MPSNEPHRFDPEHYAQLGTVVSFCAVTKHRVPFFSREPIVLDTIRIMKELAEKHGVFVVTYCYMPDHMHIDVGASDDCGTIDFVDQLKGHAARASWAHGVHRTIWQRSYWDVVTHNPDDVRAAMAYTICNPEEAGMHAMWTDYPHLGSLVYTREELIKQIPPGTGAGRSRRRRGD